MSMNNETPPSYQVNEYVWNPERWDSEDWESAPISTTRKLSIWEQNHPIVFDLPELSQTITRIALAPLHSDNKDKIYFGNTKTSTIKRSLKQGFKSGLKRRAEHGFKTDFVTTFKNHLQGNGKTDSVDHHYVTSNPIDLLNVREERLGREIMEAWVLDGMNPSPVNRISRSKFWAVKYMIKMRTMKGASCEYKP
ncbi:uncharacterized protein EAF01_007476 [Botrytis porri]|uniref:uncharacterized protein n=1 Tax=Botrytis porri TaxID=87229 RepID=UPI0019014729|nr:uncharacterized protein EAF01_007476 [Botrytis porri]KAF7902178.1 hypothetical protein EAF01_007476 [Botrytis porri]